MRIWVSLSATILRSMRLQDEPLCCGCSQEDWTSPKVQQWQGKAIEKMQKSMDKMVSKIKSLEKKVSGSSSKKKKTPMASHSLGVDPLTTPRRLPAQEPHRASSFRAKEKETTRREGGRVPRPTLQLDQDSIESKQRKLNSVELTVELTLRSHSRTLGLSTTSSYQDSQSRWNPMASSSEPSSTKAKGATHTSRKKKRSRKLDRAQSGRWSALMAACPLQTTTLLPVLWGALRSFGAFGALGREEQGRTWCMDAAQLDTQRKKEEAILKSARPPTRPAKLQLDRAGVKVKPEKCCFPLDSL
ncbi:unnamed protein product [Microthlaspi erraticum]|uniref:Uncharacterized protein n=1 Tax=Microthlaspi erraticum TaxID=1685480 RepID=A0A6D2K039_9BRAS|nr:unnamed protein product [Microthlaspi erraticum]